jgi:predicted DNA-binding transcriptional regulator AlpA
VSTQDPKLSNADAARYVGISPKTLNDWRSAGRGPSYLKIGTLVRYRQSDLDAFLDACVVKTTKEVE